MPWARTDWMSERLKFIAMYLEYEASFSDLCLDFGISRKTGYKWVRRYEAEGAAALGERSRAPRDHPNAIAADIVQAILAIRRRHRRWGPRKLRVVLARQRPRATLPAASTIGDILKRNGLVHPRRRIRRSSPYGDRLRQYDAPNAVWCADFKGWFYVGGERCMPLTISDGFSRYLLRCHALRHSLHRSTKRVFESAFLEYGLPRAIRTDNGPPFSTLAPGGLSRLAVWWIRLGVRPERILPGRPDQNGRHERMHSTLKAETAKPPRSSFTTQQRAFDRFQVEYNEERPHEAIAMRCPAELYTPSSKAYAGLPEVEYPLHDRDILVTACGRICMHRKKINISSSQVRGSESEKVDEGIWLVSFMHYDLGYIDLEQKPLQTIDNPFGTRLSPMS